jgi:hypothetical protein
MDSSSQSKYYRHKNHEPQPSYLQHNKHNHQLCIIIEGKYKPFNTHGNPLLDAIERRRLGEKSLDLWDHDSMYPTNPSTGQHPPFTGFKSLLAFVREGYNGLLGYVQQFETEIQSLQQELQNVKEDLRQMQEINNKHEEELQNKTNKIHIMRNQINQLQSTITKQENGLSSFQKRINFLTTRKKNNDIITFV